MTRLSDPHAATVEEVADHLTAVLRLAHRKLTADEAWYAATLMVALQVKLPPEGVTWPASAGATKSPEYRQVVGECYTRAGITDPKTRHQVQARLRYWVGAVVRDLLTPTELEAAGLQPLSPRDRRRVSAAEMYRDATAARARGGDPVVLLGHVASYLDHQIKESDWRQMTHEDAATARTLLDRIDALTSNLRSSLPH